MDENFHTKRLQEYIEYKKKETRFSTVEEFKKFCDDNHVFYNQGFGAKIQALVTTDEEFIDFMLKCGTIDRSEENYPWFVNAYGHSDPSNHLFFDETFIGNLPEELVCMECDDDFAGVMPNIPIVAYSADYNQHFDEPFSVCRVDGYFVYPPGTFRVNPETSAKFPAIVQFYSVDDFDRCGSIKGESLSIISLAEVSDKRIMFL